MTRRPRDHAGKAPSSVWGYKEKAARVLCIEEKEWEQVRAGSWERWRGRESGERAGRERGDTGSREIRDVQVALGVACWLEGVAPSPCCPASVLSVLENGLTPGTFTCPCSAELVTECYWHALCLSVLRSVSRILGAGSIPRQCSQLGIEGGGTFIYMPLKSR